jgi:glycosyltransferase involved in cell wall biosynthesis
VATVPTPELTVLMPVYNGERYLKEAVESILGQTFSDFEFLIVDDGSQDGTSAIVRAYGDERIRLVENGRNLGLIRTLNAGLQLARGRYVARMDADDVSLPQRLELQWRYLQRNPHVSVVGTQYRMIDENGLVLSTRKPESRDFLISFRMYVEAYNPVCHPAVMFRTEEIRAQGGYDASFPNAEDAALWFRLNSLGVRFANIPRVLVLYRTHTSQISQTHHPGQVASHYRAYVESVSRFLGAPVPVEEGMRLSVARFNTDHIRNPAEFEEMLRLKRRIALRFFEATRLGRMPVVSCVTYLWDSLLCLRGFPHAPPGYFRRLSRYCAEILCQGLQTRGRIRTAFWKGVLLASLVRVLLRKSFEKIEKRIQPSLAPHA